MKKMKLTNYLAIILAVALFSCQEETLMEPETLATTVIANSTSFPNIPDEVVEAAQAAYGNDTLPAMTIALTYTRGTTGINLEDDWSFVPYSSPDDYCIAGEESDYYVEEERTSVLTTIDGFVFLEVEDLCGYGDYFFDNRQGGWFDYVCGPTSFTIDYEGEQVFKLVHLWCE